MRHEVSWHWLKIACASMLLAAAGLSCAGEGDKEPSSSVVRDHSPSPADDPGGFSRAPDEVYDGTEAAWDLPDGAEVSRAGGLVLKLAPQGQWAAATAPGEIVDGDGVMVEADVALPRGAGSGAGVWCGTGASLDGGYAFVIGREGGWGVFRYEGGAATKLERGGVGPAELKETASTRIRLACGRSDGGGAVLGISYNDAPFVLVRDAAPLQDPWTRVGVLISRVPAAAEPTESLVRRVAVRHARS